MAKNLVVVVLDTLRHERWFPALHDGTAMPFLRELFSQGVEFPNAIASSCWTPPSHVSLLSGTDPWRSHFHIASRSADVPSAPFLAELWRRAGGESVAFSANWLVAPEVGTARGYDVFNPRLPTWLSTIVLQGIQVIGYEQLLYDRIGRMARSDPRTTGRLLDRVLQFGGTAAHRVARPLYSGNQVVRAVDRHLKARDPSRPLHLFVNLMEMHEPYPTPRGRERPGLDLTYLPSVNLARHTQALAHWGEGLEMMQPYREAGQRLDGALERLFATLRASGILDDAAVLVTSDHGQALGEHRGSFGHAFFLFDELVRIPAAYFEFRAGRPTLEPARPETWVDLRHLFDLLVAKGVEQRSDPVERILGESLERRGPATAFYEGPAPHPPRGFLLSAPVSSYHRAVRVFGPDGSCSLDDRGSPLELDEPPAPVAEHLLAYAEKAVGSARASADVGAQRDPEVDRRLRSWGYD